ncbi:HupE / UreJ protein [Pricia antarctica]|uniref:HupE / UreJ protein n=1 Tax=Pricia antarctica TaxID=641691 RepID=A0A1G7H7F2_9FLAO|nr:HupE/UreJ family protein [Pricia antarctica]SDE96370.1 HupE / UreJ protein [Pricia antarctica]
MQDFWFYIKLGLDHVLDINAYDHILFLAALALPFTFESWKKVVVLATVFTTTHCASLALSSYDLVVIDAEFIEFLIPVTIVMTAIFNLLYVKSGAKGDHIGLHVLATAFFGLIHGFGFSNYFKMLMAEEDNTLSPLLGFALGIEISQVIIVLSVLVVSLLVSSLTKVKHPFYVTLVSVLIILLTIPMLIDTFPFT